MSPLRVHYYILKVQYKLRRYNNAGDHTHIVYIRIQTPLFSLSLGCVLCVRKQIVRPTQGSSSLCTCMRVPSTHGVPAGHSRPPAVHFGRIPSSSFVVLDVFLTGIGDRGSETLTLRDAHRFLLDLLDIRMDPILWNRYNIPLRALHTCSTEQKGTLLSSLAAPHPGTPSFSLHNHPLLAI